MSIPGGFGSALIGVLISTMFLSLIKVIWYSDSPGVSYVTAYMYYMHYVEDAWAIRLLVTTVWILSTLHFSFMCHFLYYYLITNYGVPMSFLSLPVCKPIFPPDADLNIFPYQASILMHLLRAPNILP
ncbi:hypothetical protein EV401DRAFT_1891908 [Pisolithus croceorrhizus]|nr:hypothetical protein EV401DRAFT_1891908 [Pisolithus croceorrhizus]